MRPKIILDYGCNHEGDVNLALKAIEIARNAGVDAIKFQHYNAKELGKDFDYGLKIGHYRLIARKCKDVGLEWGISLFESTWDCVDTFQEMGVGFFKIAANQNKYNLNYLIDFQKQLNIQLYVSYNLRNQTHFSRYQTETDRVRYKEIYRLVCLSEYPCIFPKVALQCTGGNWGYSCHTPSYHSCIAAQLLGAPVIEKHFTLDHNTSDFRDHKHAVDPDELTAWMRWVNYYAEMGKRGDRIRSQLRDYLEDIRAVPDSNECP